MCKHDSENFRDCYDYRIRFNDDPSPTCSLISAVRLDYAMLSLLASCTIFYYVLLFLPLLIRPGDTNCALDDVWTCVRLVLGSMDYLGLPCLG